MAIMRSTSPAQAGRPGRSLHRPAQAGRPGRSLHRPAQVDRSTGLPILLLLGLIWGASFLFIKLAVADIPPLTLACARVSLAALVLYLVLRGRGLCMPRIGPIWGVFLLMGLFNSAVPYTLISAGEVYIDSGLAAILNASMPIFTIVLAHFFTEDESLSWLRV